MNRRGALRYFGGVTLASLGAQYAARAWGREVAVESAPAPSWVPLPGKRRDIAHNVLADVDPCPKRTCQYSGMIGQRAVIEAWCGAAFATAYGGLGAWVTTGGGHGDYQGNEVYAFELDTRRWVRLNDPYPGGRDSIVDYAEGEYAPEIPLSSHTYQHTQYLPPSLGGGPKGSLLLVVSYAAGKEARGSGRAHACDLATGRWSRYSVNKASVRLNATSATCFDAARKRIWRIPYGGAQIEYLDLVDRSFHVVSPGSSAGNNFGVNHTCGYDPVHDLIVVLDWRDRGPAMAWALGLASPGSWSILQTDGPTPPPETQGMGLEWCPPLRCLVGYQGSGATFVHKLVAPDTDPMRGTWHWVTEELGGDPPTRRQKGPRMSYSRFRWAPSIRSFVWADDYRLPVQAWRLLGT